MASGGRDGNAARSGGGFVVLAALALTAAAAPAQEPCPSSGEEVRMEMLLEKTIFQVDVLTLTVRIRGSEAERLRRLRERGEPSPVVRDSVARIAADATCARARLEFVRDVSLGRFLDAIRDSGRAAMEAGFIQEATFRMIDRSVSDWYAFLEGRGVKEGDRMEYRIEGDRLRIRYRAADGRLLLDRTDTGAERRRSVLAGYFAPGSDFRKGLIRSLFRDEAP